MESKNAFIIIILILIITFSIFIIDRCNKNKETFVDGLTPENTDYVESSSLTSSNFPDRTTSVYPNLSRPCNLYYVPEKYEFNGETLDMTIACEMPIFNKFKKPVDLIQNDLNKINRKPASSLTETEREIQRYAPAVIALKNDQNSVLNKKGKGYCKLDALGNNQWVELVNDEYGNVYPKKNLSNPLINAEGPPESSKYCYKKVVGGGNPNLNKNQLALNMVNNVADCLDTNINATGCSIQGTTNALANPSPLNDNETYARIAFKTLNLSDQPLNEGFADYNTVRTDRRYNYPAADPRAASTIQPCKLGIPLPTGIPGYYFKFTLDGSERITSFRLMRYNGNGMMVPYPDTAPPPNEPLDLTTTEAMEVYKELFTTQTFSSKLYIIPDNFNVEVYKFSYEACDVERDIGQISYNPELGRKTGLTFSMRDNLRKTDNTPTIVARSIYTFDPSIDSKYIGNLDKLRENQQTITQDQQKLQPPAPITNTAESLGYEKGSKIVVIDESKLFQGIQYQMFNINKNGSYGTNSTNPDVIRASKLAVDDLFKSGAFVRSGTIANNISNITSINSYNSGLTQRLDGTSTKGLGIVFTGYIKATQAGTYKFLINTDASGDFLITNIIRKIGNNYWDIVVKSDLTIASSYYGSHWMSMEGNVGSHQFQANDVIKFSARVANPSEDMGIQIFWQTPDKNGQNCGASPQNPLQPSLPALPAQYSCFRHIPDNMYFYSTEEFQKNNQEMDTAIRLNDQTNILNNAVSSIAEAYDSTVKQNIRNVIGSKLSFTGLADINDAKSDNYHIYVYIGQFETGNMTMIANDIITSADRDTPILIQSDELDISQLNNRNDTSPVGNLTAPDGNIVPVSYTVAFALNIEKTCNDWRNIFFHGKEDNWSNNMGIDRTPAIWIYPGTSQLQIKHHSTKDPNDGIDRTTYTFPLGNYAHFAMVVSDTVMKLYINGKLSEVYNVNNGYNFVWNTPVGKSFSIHKLLGRNNWSCVNGSVKIKNMLWYNKELTDADVFGLYRSTGVPERLPPPLSYRDKGDNTVDLGPANMSPWNCGNFIDPTAKWIWNLNTIDSRKVLDKDITFTNYYYAERPMPMGVTLHIIADNYATVYLNNMRVDSVTGGSENGGRNAKQIIMSFDEGQNDLKIVAKNNGDLGGLLFTFIKTNDRSILLNSTDKWVSTSSQADVNLFDDNERRRLAAEAAENARLLAAAAAAEAARLKAIEDAAIAAEIAAQNIRNAARLRQQQEQEAAINRRITAYSGPNFTGNAYIVERGEYYMTNYGTVGNTGIRDNSMQSIRIPAGNVVDVFQHPGRNGRRERYTTDVAQLPPGLAGDVSDMIVSGAENPPPFVAEPPPPPPSPPPAPVLNPQNNMIKTDLSGNRCLDVLDWRTDNGAPLIMWDCHGGTNQRWTYQNDATLKGTHSGKCIEMNDNYSQGFKYVSMQPCDGGNSRQKWVSNNNRQFINQGDNGMALNVLAANPNNRAGVIVWDKNQNLANEHWFLS